MVEVVLIGKSLCVKVKNVLSDSARQLVVVPQGSVLALIRFVFVKEVLMFGVR